MKRNDLARAEADLRKFALGFPETYEEFPWEHRAIKIKGKTFLFMYREKDSLSLSLKLPVSDKTAIGLPFASPTQYGLGKSGWVTARFGAKDNVPVDMLREWVDESFRAIAPKKLLATLSRGLTNVRTPSGLPIQVGV
jgi:predicted DNA-binding protein (MmcQ/YjbR family)